MICLEIICSLGRAVADIVGVLIDIVTLTFKKVFGNWSMFFPLPDDGE